MKRLLLILCFLSSFYIAKSNCPDHIAVAETNNCHNFQFSIPFSGENQIIHWSFDGSVPVGGGHSISHEFVENGDHQVCVTYSSSHCTEGVELCETVHVSCAEDETDCPDHIAVAETNNCHNFQFSIPVSGENQIIHWSFDGSVPVGGGHSISHEFVENGDHQVCVTYSSSHCTEGIEICETLHVSCAEDETDCPDHIAVAETNNCHNFQFSIPVSGENQIIHWSFDGSVPVGGGHSISHEFVENGDHQVCVTYSSSHCTEGIEICETVHVSCAEDETDCPDHIAVAETNNCHNFQFSIPVSGENQIIHWSFDGSVPVGGGHSISHEFVENGDHQVCVTYSSSHCTEGIEICETVHVSCAEDETDCPDHIAVAETNNCHNFQFSIPVSGENQIIHWSFDGSVPVGGGHSISHEFVENGDHQVCVTYSSSHCTEGLELCETVHVSCAEDETDCPDHIAVAETNNCHNFQFSIPVLGENQIIHWSFDGSVPVGGGHSISHEFVENGDHQVCVTYSSSHCTEGVEICETVHVGCKGVEWHLYPNPATWALTVMSTGEGMIEHIVLVSVTGKEILNWSPNSVSSSIDLTSILPGTYFVRITTNKSTSVKSFEIIR